jgi:hypothetical protein
VHDYRQIARTTKLSVWHSRSIGRRFDHQTQAGHFCLELISRVLPDSNPLPRHRALAAPAQSGAPLTATEQRSCPPRIRVPGRPISKPVAWCAALGVLGGPGRGSSSGPLFAQPAPERIENARLRDARRRSERQRRAKRVFENQL